MRNRSLSLMCAFALLLAGGSINFAQDKESPTLTGRVNPANATELKLELKHYSGKLKLESIFAPGTEVETGDVVAEVSAPELEEQIDDLEVSVEHARRSLESLKASSEMAQERNALKIESAERALARAEEALEHFRKVDRDERIRRSELNLESSKHSIQDQKEELEQLEKLYKGNDLAKESQDIVLDRSRRRLRVSEERYEMQKRDHERLKTVIIPRREEDLVHALENAKLAHKSATDSNLNGMAEQDMKLERAVRDMESKEERLEELKGDAERLVLKAPHGGKIVIGGAGGNNSVSQGLEIGDEVAKGQVLVSVVDTAKLEVTVSLTLDARKNFQPGTTVNVTAAELGETVEGKVTTVGFMVDSSGHVSALITVDNSEGKLLPGVEVKVALTE